MLALLNKINKNKKYSYFIYSMNPYLHRTPYFDGVFYVEPTPMELIANESA